METAPARTRKISITNEAVRISSLRLGRQTVQLLSRGRSLPSSQGLLTHASSSLSSGVQCNRPSIAPPPMTSLWHASYRAIRSRHALVASHWQPSALTSWLTSLEPVAESGTSFARNGFRSFAHFGVKVALAASAALSPAVKACSPGIAARPAPSQPVPIFAAAA